MPLEAVSSGEGFTTRFASEGWWQVHGAVPEEHLLAGERLVAGDIGSLCISTLWWFNWFLVEKVLGQEVQGKLTRGLGTRQGVVGRHVLFHHQNVTQLLLLLPPLLFHLLLLLLSPQPVPGRPAQSQRPPGQAA